MTVADKIELIYSSSKELKKQFLLKRYVLKGKEAVFVEVMSAEKEIDLEKMISSLDELFNALLSNGIYYIIFSLKKVFGLSDIAFALTINVVTRLQEKGGEIIFCEANNNIIRTMELLEVDHLLKFYPSEEEMLSKETV
jgi:anti-anti-sigma factor